MEKGVAEFAKLFFAEGDFITKEATKRVKNSIVRLNPVDEGQSVSEWDVALGHWPADTHPAFDPRKTATRKRLQTPIDAAEFGDAVFFENTDPVAVRLEFGYSKQAPQGIVRLTARRWRSFVAGAARAAFNKAKKKLVID